MILESARDLAIYIETLSDTNKVIAYLILFIGIPLILIILFLLEKKFSKKKENKN